jgi:hypothetical protein
MAKDADLLFEERSVSLHVRNFSLVANTFRVIGMQRYIASLLMQYR